ncbi:MAG: hypothetical protein ACJAUP_001597, partial [Cellvibrionaceae bacterium]
MRIRFYNFIALSTLLSLLTLLVILIPAHSQAAVYRYIDPNGRLLLTDTPKHGGYVRLVKTDRGWVPQPHYTLDTANKKALSPHIRKAANRHKLPYHLIHAVIRA